MSLSSLRKHTGKRTKVVVENLDTEYHSMLSGLDTLIHKNRFKEEDGPPEKKRKKQKIVHVNTVTQIKSENGPTIDSLEDVNKLLRDAVKSTMNITNLDSMQHNILPHAISGKDMVIAYENDRVLSYLLPCLHNMIKAGFKPQFGTGMIIIVPCAEVATHVHDTFSKILSALKSKTNITVGCMAASDIGYDKRLVTNTGGINVLITTPARLIINLKQKTFHHANLRVLVIDGCDNVIEMGQKSILDDCLAQLSPKRQTIVYTATLSEHVNEFAKEHMKQSPLLFELKSHIKTKVNEKILVYPLELKIAYLYSVLAKNAQKAVKGKYCKIVAIFFDFKEQAEYYYKLFDLVASHCPNMKFFFETEQGETVDEVKEKEHGLRVLFCTDRQQNTVSHFDLLVHAQIPSSLAVYRKRLMYCKQSKSSDTSILMLTKNHLKERKVFLESIADQVQTLTIPKEEVSLTIFHHAQNAVKRYKRLKTVAGIVIKNIDLIENEVTVEQVMNSMALPLQAESEDEHADEMKGQIEMWKRYIGNKKI
jgi:hypothetical protein